MGKQNIINIHNLNIINTFLKIQLKCCSLLSENQLYALNDSNISYIIFITELGILLAHFYL